MFCPHMLPESVMSQAASPQTVSSLNKVPLHVTAIAEKLAVVRDEINTAFIGRDHVVRLALAAILARGHVLIEDAPGAARPHFRALWPPASGLDFKRIQCTNDLLPADITGIGL